ncbi:hypothetical protein [Dyella sp. A6]|uniref:hypothetical protein n=1 Tax=Dyella aluminiiresistens TaxID=3069105 RepID=UPI002E796594|nr:hypothetical protein [Dyella sp. A6]
MRFHSGRKHRYGLIGLALSTLLCACSQGAAGENGSQAPATSSGMSDAGGMVYYLEQSGTVATMGGINRDLAFYKSMLRNCRDAHLPTTPLDSADEAKLGTVQVKYWHDGDRRSALLIDDYHVDASLSNRVAMCHFRLKYTSRLTIVRDGRVYDLDLVKRTGSVQVMPTDNSADIPMVAPDWEQLAQAGIHKAGQGSYAGQPCVIVKNELAQTTYCVWTGGSKQDRGAQAPEEFPNRLSGKMPVFWSKSDAGGNAFKTTSFVVGHLPYSTIFDIPSDITVRNMGGP